MKKKILFLHPALVIGGCETVLINYLNILAENDNYDVYLSLVESCEKYNIEKIDKKIKVKFLLSEIEAQFSRYIHWKLQDINLSEQDRWYYSSWNNYIKNEKVERLLEDIEHENYDVIFDFQGSFGILIEHHILDKIRVPTVYWIHADSDFNVWLYDIEKYKSIFDKHKLLVTICNDMKDKCHRVLIENFNLYDKDVVTIFNPSDERKILELAKEEVNDSDRELLKDDFILQVARLAEAQKNHLEMIEIFYKLKQKGITEKLYIIGEGSSRIVLEEKIKELNLENECLLLGNRMNPFPFMKKAKLFIHTAKFEGLGMVLIESMMCGVPVVAYDCPTGPREILADGKYGELIPMGNSELFIEKTYELLTNPEKRAHFVQLLPESVKRFGMEEIGKQFFEMIEEITKK